MLEPIITNKGKEELTNALAGGRRINFARLHLGSGVLMPSRETERLTKLEEDIPIATVMPMAAGLIHIAGLADNNQTEYPVREIGIVSDTGVLLAVMSSNGQVLAQKLKTQDLAINFDMILEEFAEGVLHVTGPGERLNLNLTEELARVTNAVLETQAKLADVMFRLSRLERGGMR